MRRSNPLSLRDRLVMAGIIGFGAGVDPPMRLVSAHCESCHTDQHLLLPKEKLARCIQCGDSLEKVS